MSGRYSRRLRLALSALEDAGGRPLSYAELSALGVEHPAQTVYELEIAGEPIVHTSGGVLLDRAHGRREPGHRERRELPTNAESRSKRTRRARAAAVRIAIALALAALLLAGAYLLGGALGDNGEEVRAEAEKGYREGFDKGHGRGYRATYKSARRRAERAAAEAQAAASESAPSATAAQPAPTSSESSSDQSGEPSSDDASDSSELEACTNGDGLCTPEENAR